VLLLQFSQREYYPRGHGLKQDNVSPVVKKVDPVVELVSNEQWVKSLNRLQKKEAIESCLDEYDATLEIIGKYKKVNPEQLKVAKSWCNQQKQTLRLLGYRKRLPAIGEPRIKLNTIDDAGKSIFS